MDVRRGGDGSSHEVEPAASRFPGFAALASSGIAMVLAFWGLFEWDVALTRFIRSLNDVHLDHLTNPLLAYISDIGDRLGRGESLVALSLFLLAIGYGFKRPVWTAAGWETLLAHALAAIVSNVAKHAVGRPRPKFMHAGNLELSPATGNGWDSFPSGHATASWAVAVVLAVRFPRIRWPVLGFAAALAGSRILGGSHFLTDAVGGAVLGYLVGIVAAHPLREWRASLASALISISPFPAAILALVWIVGHHPSDLWPTPQLIGGGMLFTFAGLAAHAWQAIHSRAFPSRLSNNLAYGLIGVGLGMTTGSPWVAATVFCVCLSHWVDRQDNQPRTAGPNATGLHAWTKEAAFTLLVLLALLASVELRGVLPMV